MVKKSFKKSFIAFASLLIFMISANQTGSLAYFSHSGENKGNTISTGNFPKARIRIYASAGPLYKGAHGFMPKYESTNYSKWLDNASSYILADLKGSPPSIQDPDGKDSDLFKNIENDRKISRKLDISSSAKNWNGLVEGYDGDEMGNMVHYVVAIESPRRFGLESASQIKLGDPNLNIKQHDVYKSSKTEREYMVNRDSSKLDPVSNPNRVRTYAWNGKGYDSASLLENPGDSKADLIIFDIGSKGYYSEDTDQKSLDYLYAMLCAKEPHGFYYVSLFSGNTCFYTSWVGAMGNIVENQMKPAHDLYCYLDRMECEVDFTYQGMKVPVQKKTVRFGEESKSVISKTPSSSPNPEKNDSGEVELKKLKIKTK